MNKFMKRMANKQRKGFTLVELVVVILIIAILAAAIFLGGATVIKQARERQVMNDLRNFGTYVQDMLYENPNLQYFEGTFDADTKGYGNQEGYTYDATNETITGSTDYKGEDFDGTAELTNIYSLPVLALFNDYLTDDFKLGDVVDAWDNPYLWSYDMSPSTATADPASCIIVISSLGVNSLDETSDASADTATAIGNGVAELVIGNLGTTYKSATDVVETALKDATTSKWKTSDDYGVVIVMIDGQVSVDYYGF